MKVIHAFRFVFLLVCCCFASLHDPNQPEQFPSPALPTCASRSVANTTDLGGTGQDPITSIKTSPAGVGTPGASLQHGPGHQTAMSSCAPEAGSHWCLQKPLRKCWYTLVLKKTHSRLSLLLLYLLILNMYVCIDIYTHIYNISYILVHYYMIHYAINIIRYTMLLTNRFI